jgi:hypothetical protein
MSFVRDGIDRVRVLVLPDGVADDGRGAAVSRSALVTWRSCHSAKLHQAYINGRFAGATVDVEQRRLVIQSPCSPESAVRVEVVAVESAEADIDFAGQLGQAVVNDGRVRLTLLRSQTLPAGATINIYRDNGTGEIDYTVPLNPSPIAVWPCTQDKAGFGMARFGAGDFGYDAAASIGFGSGVFGLAEFGLDADLIEWISPALPAGKYRFGTKVSDALGNESPVSETDPITVVPAPKPVEELDVATFDLPTSQLTLRVIG